MLKSYEKTKFSLEVPDKILIAEDEPTTRLIFSTLLQDEGYEVVSAENGAECVELAKSSKPDVILLDLQMPVMDGYEAMRILKSNVETRDIPIIILSANSDPHSVKTVFELGATEFLPKPVNIEELLIRVGTVLKIKKANDEIKKLRSEFTYLLVQDLKNTISVIKATFELALKDKFNELTEDQKLILDIAESAINNHIKLLDEYLELSRLELNIDKITRESANIAQLIQGVINKFKTDQKYKDLNINFSPDIEVNLEVDVKKISRVFELLFGAIFNAGGRDIEISLGDDGTSCTIKVWDKNTRIEREEAEYIFDRYKQAVKQKIPRYKDLGLMICRIIVEAHNGKIWAEPLDEGTAFFIKIPKVS